MASNNSNFSVHSESATRAPVVPQLATGVDRHSADDQGRAQSATGIESDLQARSGGMDLESDTHPGHFDIRKCPGCGGKPGSGGAFSLAGERKAAMRDFVQEERHRLLQNFRFLS